MRVLKREPGGPAVFERVEKSVRADWLTAHARGIETAAARHLARYKVDLPPQIEEHLRASPVAQPLLRPAR